MKRARLGCGRQQAAFWSALCGQHQSEGHDCSAQRGRGCACHCKTLARHRQWWPVKGIQSTRGECTQYLHSTRGRKKLAKTNKNKQRRSCRLPPSGLQQEQPTPHSFAILDASTLDGERGSTACGRSLDVPGRLCRPGTTNACLLSRPRAVCTTRSRFKCRVEVLEGLGTE